MLEDFNARGIYLSEDDYRIGLRALFPEDYQHLSHEALEDIIYNRIAEMSPSEAEGFFSSIGNFIKDKVAPVAVAALPVAATVAGTAFGGPVGAAIGGAAGKFAANAISKGAKIQPNQSVSAIGGAVTSIAGGNYKAALPSIINLGGQLGNAISPGAGNKFRGVASSLASAGTAIAGGNYQGAVPGLVQAGSMMGNAAGPGSNAAQGQLLNFIKSTPFLQSLLSSITTGNLATGLQIPKEDGSSTTVSYVEMLEALKQLADSAIAEADNAGVYGNLAIESESDRDGYIETLVEDISNYENTLLPNYDTVTY